MIKFNDISGLHNSNRKCDSFGYEGCGLMWTGQWAFTTLYIPLVAETADSSTLYSVRGVRVMFGLIGINSYS